MKNLKYFFTYTTLCIRKRFSIFIYCFLVLAVKSYAASAVLKWSMNIDSFEKKVPASVKYEDEYFTIAHLPKGSVYNNDYDEYLVFGKNVTYSEDKAVLKSKKELVRRIQKTDLSEKEFFNFIKTKYNRFYKYSEKLTSESETEYNVYEIKKNIFIPVNSITSRDILEESFEEFPSKYSLEVIMSLLYNPSYDCKVFSDGRSTENLISAFFFENATYIVLDFDDHNGGFDSKEFTYFIDYKYHKLKEIMSNFEENALSVRYKKAEKMFMENAGPFGTAWGMNKNQLELICADHSKLSNKITDISSLNEKIEDYANYYNLITLAGATTIKKFSPKKSVDSISEYYAVFDSEKGLYQVFTVANYSRALTPKEMDSYSKKNGKSFSELKSTLTEQYGNPKENSKNSLYWITNKGIKIELFSEEKLVRLYSFWDGKEYGGMDYFTCLVYTDSAKYEKLVSAEKTIIQEKKEQEEAAAKTKDAEQKSFF